MPVRLESESICSSLLIFRESGGRLAVDDLDGSEFGNLNQWNGTSESVRSRLAPDKWGGSLLAT